MANKLKFPIGFDLKSGVQEAANAWKSTYRKQLQDKINKHPIKVKLAFDANDKNLKYIKDIIKLSRDLDAMRQSALKTQREEIALLRDKEKLAKDVASREKEQANAATAQAKAGQATAQEAARTQKMEADALNAKNRALRQATTMYQQHDGLLKRMLKKSLVLFGAHQAMRFLKNIRDVTKEMELQRVSLGALVGGMDKANAIYAQIKDAALKSPFKINDLTKYTKQLAAYKIETDELFDTTMRLADISAGLGVSMDRIILAYGQIRATGYLRATEVRQLTEAGIPIVEELAQKLTAVNGELVTAGDVMGRISERAISFEMVKSVFEDMTNAGGLFYDMQAKQSETLYGQWENLKDALTIMYSEMGNTHKVYSAMQGIIKASTYLLNNWETLASIAKTTLYTFLTYKTAIALFGALGVKLSLLKLEIRAAGGFMKFLAIQARALAKALMSNAIFFAIGAIITLIDEWISASAAEAEALEKVNKLWAEREQTLQDLQKTYDEIRASAEEATDADTEFAKNIYSKKLEALQKLINLLAQFGMDNVIDLQFVNAENIDETFDAWTNKVIEATAETKKFSEAVAILNNANQGKILGLSLFGDNLKTDMDDLSKTWAELTTGKIGRIIKIYRGAALDEFKNNEKYEGLYEQISTALGMEAELAFAQKQRNETEYQYQARLTKNWKIMREEVGKYLEMMDDGNENKKNLKSIYKDMPTYGQANKFERDLTEVMKELNKHGKELFMGDDVFAIRMAIDTAGAENDWTDWQKEAITDKINEERIKVGLELVPTSLDGTKSGSVLEGYRARLKSEFAGLFTDEELSKMFSVESIEEALKKKLKSAEEAYAKSLTMVTNPDMDVDKVQKEIDKVRKELAEETNKPEKEQDKEKIETLQKQLVAYQGMNDKIKEQVELTKAATKAEYEKAKAANETFLSGNKTQLQQDVQSNFGGLMASPESVMQGQNFSFQITEEELSKVSDIAELYDLWLQKTEEIEQAQTKLKEAGISEETVAAEQERIETENAAHQARMDAIDAEMAAMDTQGQAIQEYIRLSQELNSTTDPTKRLELEARINQLMQDENVANYIKLGLEKGALRLAIQRLATAKAANDEIAAYLDALAQAAESNAEMGTRYNFSRPARRSRGGSKEDPWLILMRNRMKYMQDFEKGYATLAKKMQDTDALLQEQTIMFGRGAQLGIDAKSITAPKEDLLAWYDKAIEEVTAKIQKLGGKSWSGLGIEAILKKDTKSQTIKKYQQLLADIYAEMTKFKTDDVAKTYEKKLKELTDKVSRTQVAKDFFDKMLNITGNREYSMNLTMSLYGIEGNAADALNKVLQEQAKALFGSIDITDAFKIDGTIDYSKLQKYLPQLEKDDTRTEAARKFVEDGIKGEADWLLKIEEGYKKVFDFEARRTAVHKREAENRAKIDAESIPYYKKQELKKASKEQEEREITEINLEEFKESDDWIMVFENIDRVGSRSINHLMVLIQEFIEKNKQLKPTEIRALMTEYNKLYEAAITRNPFKALTSGTGEYFKALHQATQAHKELKAAKAEEDAAEKESVNAASALASLRSTNMSDTHPRMVAALNKVKNAEDRLAKAQKKRAAAEARLRKAENAKVAALSKVKKGLEDTMTAYNALGEIASTIQDTFNVDEASNFGVALTSIGQALTMVAGVLGVVNAMITLIETHPLVLALSAAIMAIIGGIMLFRNLKTRDAEAEIKRLDTVIEDLEYSYERLEKAQEKALGDELIKNYQSRYSNLLAQQQAYLDQAEAERSKGKMADEEKIKEYEEAAREAADSILDMEGELSERFLGTDMASAARDFASSWIEAYKEFGNTADAMSEKFEEMIHNMITESFAAKVMEAALGDVFSEIENMMKDGSLDMDEATRIAALTEVAVGNIDVGMTNLMSALEAAGLSVRGMGGDLTGISRDIATASEESILGLAAGINTQNFYISQVPAKMDTIIALLQGGNAVQGSAITLSDLVTLQNEHLSYLPTIAQHTADTVAKCEQIVSQTQRAADALEKVIKPEGTKSSYKLNITLSN